MDKEIVGGVSPLKKRGGKAAKRVTRNATGKGVVSGYKGRGGYKKSGGGKNPGGYNVHTRFKPRAKQEGPKGGTTAGAKEPTDNKPYTYDKDGKLVININNTNTNTNNNNNNQNQDQIQTQTNPVKEENDKLNSGVEYRGGEVTNTRKSGGSFKKVWGENKDNFQDKWANKGGYEGWKKKAQEEIDGGYYSETRTVNGKKEKRSWTQKNDEAKVWTEWGPA